jgi:hypothetical protein
MMVDMMTIGAIKVILESSQMIHLNRDLHLRTESRHRSFLMLSNVNGWCFFDPPIDLKPAYQLTAPAITAVTSEATHLMPIVTGVAQPESQVQRSLIGPTAAAGDGTAARKLSIKGQEGHKGIAIEG